MKLWVESHLNRWLSRWVQGVQEHARSLLVADLAVTLALLIFVVPQLSINMDHKRLIDPSLPFQRAAATFSRYFANMDDAILIVVDGETAERAREGAQVLAEELRRRPDRFHDVYAPGAEPFFQRNALLYRTPGELDDFSDHLATLQPILAELSRDPSIANLANLIRTGLEHERAHRTAGQDWSLVLNRISDATVRVFDEYPVSISWESLMLEGSPFDPGTRQVIVVQPVLEFDKFLVAQAAIAEIRAAAASLSLSPERGVRVRITGNPALNYEEMLELAWDIGVSSIFSFLLVVAVLFIAFRSLKLMAAAAATLLVGLVWTAALATLTVGQLNVVSIAFGVLFIGLGIDFAIHLVMQYVELREREGDPRKALGSAVQRSGSALVLCAVTTMVGFYSFLPTPFRGVAELGLIAGTGMAIILLQTLTLLPAMITVLDAKESGRRPPPAFHLHLTPPRLVSTHPKTVAIGAALVTLGASALLPQLRFDANVVNMRDPSTESVQAFDELLADSLTSPWSIDVLAASLPDAARRGQRLQELPPVESTTTLLDYVPAEQDEKIEMLAETAMILDAPGGVAEPQELPVSEQIAALQDLHDELGADWLRDSAAPMAGAARRLRDELASFLERVRRDGDGRRALQDLEHILLGSFPQQMDRLRQALEPSPITLEDLPSGIVSRMLSPDGHARVQVFPRDHLGNTAEMSRFVDAVRKVEPDASGVAVNLVEFGRATVTALREALLGALLAIALTVFVLFRRVDETLLVLAPVLLAGVITGAFMVLLGISFHFANVVVLPLLLGVGVDSGIHLVHRARGAVGDLLDTTTARAVFYSALTTIASFGSLALSGHRGIASLGVLLVCGMLAILACNLLVLPALIALRRER